MVSFWTTTPKAVSEETRVFCRSITNTDIEPIFVDVHTFPGAIMDACFDNVSDVIVTNRGRSRLGWLIWENDIIFEAIFHAVWQSPDGQLVDVTPHVDGETKILFLPDMSISWTDRSDVKKRYFAKINNPAVEEYINQLKWEEVLFRRYRVPLTGEVLIPRRERRDLDHKNKRVLEKITKYLEKNRTE